MALGLSLAEFRVFIYRKSFHRRVKYMDKGVGEGAYYVYLYPSAAKPHEPFLYTYWMFPCGKSRRAAARINLRTLRREDARMVNRLSEGGNTLDLGIFIFVCVSIIYSVRGITRSVREFDFRKVCSRSSVEAVRAWP